jgi:hypothetical protein
MACASKLPLKQVCITKNICAVTSKAEWNTRMQGGIHRDGSGHMRHVRVNAVNTTSAKPAGK